MTSLLAGPHGPRLVEFAVLGAVAVFALVVLLVWLAAARPEGSVSARAYAMLVWYQEGVQIIADTPPTARRPCAR